jgi:hypothetical protein
MDRALAHPPPWWMTSPKEVMWKAIAADYTPSPKPSHSACAPPEGNSPTPAIRAAAKAKSRLIFSTIARLATGHCFDEPYSTKFRPNADDIITCPCHIVTQGAQAQTAIFTYPCGDIDPPNPIVVIMAPITNDPNRTSYPHASRPTSPNTPTTPRPCLHTKEHVIFRCPLTQTYRDKHLEGIATLREAFRTEENTKQLCLFLRDSQSSLFRPLPKPRPCPEPPRPDPP